MRTWSVLISRVQSSTTQIFKPLGSLKRTWKGHLLEARTLQEQILGMPISKGRIFLMQTIEQTNFKAANLEGAVWVNGKRVISGSVGELVFEELDQAASEEP